MLRDLRAFLLRGNVLDLAVAFVLGTAFGAVVNTFAKNVLLGLVSAFLGVPDFDDVGIGLGGDRLWLVGPFLTAVVNFLLIGTALFFIIRMAARFQRPADETPTPDSDEVVLLREIRDTLRQSKRL
jgi:large conductance mechanosensitive channel